MDHIMTDAEIAEAKKIDRLQILKRNPINSTTFSALFEQHDAFVDHRNNTEIDRETALILIATFAAKLPLTVRIDRDDAIEFVSLAIHDDLDTYLWVSTYLPHDKTAMCACCVADETYSEEDHCELHAILDIAMH